MSQAQQLPPQDPTFQHVHQNQQQQHYDMQQQMAQQAQQQMQAEQFVPLGNQSAMYPQQNQNQMQGTMGNYSAVSQYDANGRRHYPKTLQQQKTEWNAVEQHKKEVDFEIQRNEKAIRDIKLKHLLTELDRKLLAEYEAKKEKLLIKQMELEEMGRQQQAYHHKLQQNRADKVQIQNHLANYYDQQKQQQQNRDNQYKNQKMEWEQRLVDYNRERLVSEERKRGNEKDYLLNEKKKDLQREHIRKNKEHQQYLQDQKEYNELMRINNEKQMIKDENYKQFYKDVAENQEQSYLLHYDNVMRPMLEKIAELERIIARDANELNSRRAKQELAMLLKRKEEFQNMSKENFKQMMDHDKQNQAYKAEKQEKVKGRLQDLANYQQYLEHERNKKFEKQAEVKNWLDAQQEEKRQQFLNQERMTRNEKGLNRLDLQAYKEQEGGMYSMIPGWAPQIGQLPPRQNREQLTRQIMETMKPANQRTLSDLHNVRPNYTAQGGFGGSAGGGSRLANAGNNSMANLPNVSTMKEYQRIGETDEHYAASQFVVPLEQTIGKEYQRRDIYKYNHNPITNPMPYNMQNPYISQQYLNISDQNTNQGQYQQPPNMMRQQQNVM